MPGSGKIGTTHVWRRRFYRRPAGVGWVLALALVPLLLAGLGFGVSNRSDSNGPNLTLPSINGPKLPGLSFSPLSILRNGNAFTLTGDLPDVGARASLIDMLKGVFGRNIQLTDKLNIKPGSSPLDFAGLTAVLKAAASIPDFNFNVSGETVTLTGTAASDDENAAVEAAAIEAWPNMNIVNEMSIQSLAPEAAPSISAPEAAPSTPAPEAPGSTRAPVSADCGNLQREVTDLMRVPVTFVTGGFTLSSGSQQQLSRVADKLAACPDKHVTVNGYTDNTGNDGINVPLSTKRAQSVVDFLVSQGVAAGHVSGKGFGAADPVASNDTPDGRAQNRRVMIVVS